MTSQSTKQSNIQPLTAKVNASYGVGITCRQSMTKSKLWNWTGRKPHWILRNSESHKHSLNHFNQMGRMLQKSQTKNDELQMSHIIMMFGAYQLFGLLLQPLFHQIKIFVLAAGAASITSGGSRTTTRFNYIASVLAGIFIVQFTQQVQTIEQVAEPLAAS
ncbi:MAG: hypothetical protein EZS28_044948 [Streblomastix strix]|uniref:Uncharacterized protein n=1 Tax=Streblomastix strix TaxID=222440 RepID=A0A5J4TQ56_9EUKA|nr:MAG: hypothetical protein EZS28_044948 [Streblomastix strix]